jgi:hypothetical protein
MEMPTPECPEESKISAALAVGEIPAYLLPHLSTCPICAAIHSTAMQMRLLASHLAAEAAPSATSMWWRVTLRMRREGVRRAEKPLIWMTRISCGVAALTAALLALSIPMPSHPAAEIGCLALSAVVIPVSIILWGWSRSKI